MSQNHLLEGAGIRMVEKVELMQIKNESLVQSQGAFAKITVNHPWFCSCSILRSDLLATCLAGLFFLAQVSKQYTAPGRAKAPLGEIGATDRRKSAAVDGPVFALGVA